MDPGTPVTVGAPRSLKEAVIAPLVEYFSRRQALTILAFIVLYKIGDTMAGAMTTPFFLDIQFTKSEIGMVVKIFGSWATIAGGLAGGLLMLRMGIRHSLWIFGALQAASTAGFAFLAGIGHSVAALAGVVAFENLSSGMGTAAYAAFMASMTDKRFTATQYALLSSLMGFPRVVAAAPTGWMPNDSDGQVFFWGCTLLAAPGLLLLFQLTPRREETILTGSEHE